MRVAGSSFSSRAPEAMLETSFFAPLAEEHANLDCVVDAERTKGRNYYRDVCFKIHARTPAGEMLELADGGSVAWTETLLSDKKERLVISGIGSERVCTAFEA